MTKKAKSKTYAETVREIVASDAYRSTLDALAAAQDMSDTDARLSIHVVGIVMIMKNLAGDTTLLAPVEVPPLTS